MPWSGVDQYLGNPWGAEYRGPVRPMWSPQEEGQFQEWYRAMASMIGLNKNPDAAGQMYDYRGAYGKSQGGDASSFHWPSENKFAEHPRRYINGYDTITGGLAPMATNWIWEP